jgi:hypothetical protein
VVEAVDAGVQQAVLRALSLYSNAVLARGKIDLGERHEEAGIVQAVERKENTLVLSLGSFVDPKIDWADSNYKAK